MHRLELVTCDGRSYYACQSGSPLDQAGVEPVVPAACGLCSSDGSREHARTASLRPACQGPAAPPTLRSGPLGDTPLAPAGGWLCSPSPSGRRPPTRCNFTERSDRPTPTPRSGLSVHGSCGPTGPRLFRQREDEQVAAAARPQFRRQPRVDVELPSAPLAQAFPHRTVACSLPARGPDHTDPSPDRQLRRRVGCPTSLAPFSRGCVRHAAYTGRTHNLGTGLATTPRSCSTA